MRAAGQTIAPSTPYDPLLNTRSCIAPRRSTQSCRRAIVPVIALVEHAYRHFAWRMKMLHLLLAILAVPILIILCVRQMRRYQDSAWRDFSSMAIIALIVTLYNCF